MRTLGVVFLLLLPILAFPQAKPLIVVTGDDILSITSNAGGVASASGGIGWALGSSHVTVSKQNRMMELTRFFIDKCPSVEVTTDAAKTNPDYAVAVGNTLTFMWTTVDQLMVVNRAKHVLFVSKREDPRRTVKQVCAVIKKDWKSAGMVDSASRTPAPSPVTAQANLLPQATNANRPGAAPSTPTAHGKRAWLGAESTDEPNVRHNGVTLSGVDRNGPAYNAGLRAGDVILNIAGTYIYTIEDLGAEILKHEPGSRVSVRYMRGDSTNETYVVLGEKPTL